MKLSQRIYACAQKLWPQYLCHPFVVQMADGTLPEEKFRYYMLQDYLYLRDYVKIFAAIIQKADDFEHTALGHDRRDISHTPAVYAASRRHG